MRSLELKPKRTLTTGTFNLVVKDPIPDPHWAVGSDTTGHSYAASVCPRNLSNISRDSPCCQPLYIIDKPGSTGFGVLIAKPIRNAQHAVPHAMAQIYSAQRAPERIDSIKDLVLEVLRLPRTLPGRLSPIIQPCGQGSFLEAVLQQMPQITAGIHFLPTHTDDNNASR